MITVFNQEELDRDVPRLLDLKTRLGVPWGGRSSSPRGTGRRESLDGLWDLQIDARQVGRGPQLGIVGGKRGPGARPMHPDWARSLRDQCQEAGVPFFFKQWGDWRVDVDAVRDMALPDERYLRCSDARYIEGYGQLFARVGKKAAGALLDGREWREMPG